MSLKSHFNKNYFILIFIIVFISCGNSSSSEEVITEPEIIEEETETPIDNETTYTSVVEEYGQLSVSGNKILDKNGNAIQLRGMSFFWSQWIGKYYHYHQGSRHHLIPILVIAPLAFRSN